MARIAPAGMAAETMSERQLETGIRAILADLPSLRWYHTFDSRRSPSGFPDLVVVGCSVLYRELKTAKGRLTAAQDDWQRVLRAAGADVAVWRPDSLLDGTIARELAAIAGLRGAA